MGNAAPDAAIVTAATWLGGALAAYLGCCAAAVVITTTGRRAGRWSRRLAATCPPLLRRLVEGALAASLTAATVTAGGGAAVADGPAPAPPLSLDWPAAATAATPPAVTVRAGDSLWSIAADCLEPSADAGQVARAWPRWWQRNHDVIGSNPDLIHPGQRLTTPALDRRSARCRHRP